jgi:RNA recognition motif-containing protein
MRELFVRDGLIHVSNQHTIKREENQMKIFVGNLSREVTDDDLRQAFESFGKVESATVVKDRFTGEGRGFGFVEMPSASEAQSAINGMNGKELKGKALNVNEARPKEERRGGRGGRGRSGSGRRY